ncbi:MAG: NUDIX hydrolase [bacterium]
MRKRATGMLIHQDKILMIYRKRRHEEFYYLPGGQIEIDENPFYACYREMYEETGVVIKNHKLVFEYHHIDEYENLNNYEYYFTINEFDGEPELYANGDHSDLEAKAKMTDDNFYTLEWVDIMKIDDIIIKPHAIKDKIKEEHSRLCF